MSGGKFSGAASGAAPFDGPLTLCRRHGVGALYRGFLPFALYALLGASLHEGPVVLYRCISGQNLSASGLLASRIVAGVLSALPKVSA